MQRDAILHRGMGFQDKILRNFSLPQDTEISLTSQECMADFSSTENPYIGILEISDPLRPSTPSTRNYDALFYLSIPMCSFRSKNDLLCSFL